jgi:hypothetical protein
VPSTTPLAEAGGSLPVWLVLISLKSGQRASQLETLLTRLRANVSVGP